MQKILLYLFDSVLSGLRRRSTLQIEVIVLRHQLDVLQRTRRLGFDSRDWTAFFGSYCIASGLVVLMRW